MYLFGGGGVVVVSEGLGVVELSLGVFSSEGFLVPGVVVLGVLIVVVFSEGEPGHEFTIMKVPTKNIEICNSRIFCSIEGNE